MFKLITPKIIIRPHKLYRFYSQFSIEDIGKARKWIEITEAKHIPQSEFDISYSRSSGAGGQKVNKTSSKATISLEPEKWLTRSCYWIPEPIKQQLREKPVRYETKSGGLLIQSDSSRSRYTNTSDCFEKLILEIKEKVYFESEVKEEDVKKWQELATVRAEKIKFKKKLQSDKKKSRSKKFDI